MVKYEKMKTFQLFSGSCDRNGDVRLTRLAEIFAEVADEQVEDLKAQHPFLCDESMRWILMRYHMEIEKLPHMNDVIQVCTYQSQYSKYVCSREHIVTDSQGREMIYARCQWIMRDENTGRICAVPPAYQELTSPKPARSQEELPKLADKPIAEGAFVQTRWDDYDFNQHVNNTKYFSFIRGAEAARKNTPLRPVQIDIHYKNGMRLGENYRLFSEEQSGEDGSVRLYQKIASENELAAIMQSKWAKRG